MLVHVIIISWRHRPCLSCIKTDGQRLLSINTYIMSQARQNMDLVAVTTHMVGAAILKADLCNLANPSLSAW